MKQLTHWSLIIFAVMVCNTLSAQYYDWGRSPSSIKWSSLKTPYNKLVFPSEYERNAIRIAHYLDTIRPQIGFGYLHGVMRTPVVIHTQNFIPNGIVLLAPKRMEFIVMPGGAASATPWLKQLSVHEYRHSVQFNNLNRGLIRILSYPLGQQGSLIGGALLPSWFMEGDAVLAETQMTTFGRGLQPSFTLEYRALLGEGENKYAMDKYFCGSYKDYIPDHYQLGYQIVSWSDTHYGENIGDKMAHFGARNPYMIFTSTIAIKKYFRTSVDEMFTKTFKDLHQHWNTLPKVENSATIIPTPTTSYTTYLAPVQVNDTTIIALKKDLDHYSRLVEINPATGAEHTLSYTGMVNTTPTYKAGKLYWSEFRPSVLWTQQVNSVLCTYDLTTKKCTADKQHRQILYPTPVGSDKVAHIEYNYNGTYTINSSRQSLTLSDSVALYGLAYDNITCKLYVLALGQRGMWIGATNHIGTRQPLTIKQITPSTYSTLSNLRAADGKLYYNSIASGKDEVHIYDIASGKEYQLTESTYGSFAATPTAGSDKVTLTTYSTNGYLISQQSVTLDSLREVPFRTLPKNIVNPKRRDWNLMNIDTIDVSAQTPQTRPVKRYRKGLNLLNVHSWMPVSIDPERIIEDYNFNLYAGATIMSQDLLASTFAQLSYGWTDAGSMVRAKIKYYGLAPKLELETQWGGRTQSIIQTKEMENISLPNLKHYFDITARAYLPLTLSGGYHIRTLTPMVEWTHTNMVMPDNSFSKFVTGVEQLQTTLQFIDNVRMAPRDFLPRWGYAFSLSHLCNPVRNNFGQVWSLFARALTPGVSKHHSLMVRMAAQFQNTSTWNFTHKMLVPRGAEYNFTPHRYYAASADYQFPLCYPDGGIRSFLYFKRIRANLTFDYARYHSTTGHSGDIYSYGGDLIFDLNPFRLPSSVGVELKITLHKASTHKGAVLGAEFALPF